MWNGSGSHWEAVWWLHCLSSQSTSSLHILLVLEIYLKLLLIIRQKPQIWKYGNKGLVFVFCNEKMLWISLTSFTTYGNNNRLVGNKDFILYLNQFVVLQVLSFKINVGHFPHLADLVTRINYNHYYMSDNGNMITAPGSESVKSGKAFPSRPGWLVFYLTFPFVSEDSEQQKLSVWLYASHG